MRLSEVRASAPAVPGCGVVEDLTPAEKHILKASKPRIPVLSEVVDLIG